MSKTHPTRRNRYAKASEGLPDDRTISGPRRTRKASTAAPTPAHHQDTNTPGPSAVGAEPAWMDQLLDKLDSRIQTAVNEALNARQAAVSINSAGSPPPGGRGTGSAGVHAGFRLGIHDGYRSLMLIYHILHTNID